MMTYAGGGGDSSTHLYLGTARPNRSAPEGGAPVRTEQEVAWVPE
jgi:hypothetical protein